MRKIVLSLLIPLFIVGCGQVGGKKKADDGDKGAKKEIIIPVVPSIYSSPEDKMSYLAKHYWDNFDFTDTTYVDLPEITEQTFANYAYLLNSMPREKAVESLKNTIEKTEADTTMFSYFSMLFDKYFYEPNSPVANEELFIMVLQQFIAKPNIREISKARPRAQLEMALKNRVGERANDFVLTTKQGRKMSLYSVKSDYVILFFNDPECAACAGLTEDIKASGILMPLVKQGKLKMVMMYPEEDVELWRTKHISLIPDDWINGYDADQAIKNKKLYDTKAIPTLYVLDKNKVVRMKDASMIHQLEQYFTSEGF